MTADYEVNILFKIQTIVSVFFHIFCWFLLIISPKFKGETAETTISNKSFVDVGG